MRKMLFFFKCQSKLSWMLLGLIMGTMSVVQAADPSVALTIRVIVSTDEIRLGPDPFPSYVEMLKVPLDRSTISTNHLGVKNIGFSPIRLTISLQAIRTTEPTDNPWVYAETDFLQPLPDYHFRLAGIFTDKERAINFTDFNNNDILLRAGRVCSGQAHAWDGENNNFKGYNVGPDQWRTMFFRLDLPANGTDGELAVTINVSAELEI